MLPCGYDNDAVCELRHGKPVWSKVPDHVHISEELVADATAGPIVLATYNVIGHCPWDARMLHGDHVHLALTSAEIRPAGAPG